jgi:hypothetical protein
MYLRLPDTYCGRRRESAIGAESITSSSPQISAAEDDFAVGVTVAMDAGEGVGLETIPAVNQINENVVCKSSTPTGQLPYLVQREAQESARFDPAQYTLIHSM